MAKPPVTVARTAPPRKPEVQTSASPSFISPGNAKAVAARTRRRRSRGIPVWAWFAGGAAFFALLGFALVMANLTDGPLVADQGGGQQSKPKQAPERSPTPVDNSTRKPLDGTVIRVKGMDDQTKQQVKDIVDSGGTAVVVQTGYPFTMTGHR